MNDQHRRYERLRYTATGALAALAAAGAIAGAVALAANSHADKPGHAAVAHRRATKTPTSPVPDKTHTPPPAVNHQPFFSAVQRLVDDGTISDAQRQAVDREIRAGGVDTDTLASGGFTPTQLRAVAHALSNAKRALARNVQ
jgi:uncharacterized membrane protein YebE (DUF533 family)